MNIKTFYVTVRLLGSSGSNRDPDGKDCTSGKQVQEKIKDPKHRSQSRCFWLETLMALMTSMASMAIAGTFGRYKAVDLEHTTGVYQVLYAVLCSTVYCHV